MSSIFFAGLTAFAVTFALCPLVIYLVKRFKAQQVILHYVEDHKAKSGVPTMGGIAFILGIGAGALLFLRGEKRLAVVALGVMAGYGVIGFLDDFLKIKYKRNLGLRAYQKLTTQTALAAIVAVFAYNSPYIGGEIFLPFTFKTVDLGLFAIPFAALVFIALTNCVNLTDGLDALASSVTAVYTAGFAAILYLAYNFLAREGAGPALLEEYANLLAVCAAVAGGALAFICFNAYPAKVFMGDCGSLALGGAAGALAVFSRMSLLVPLLGIVFVASGASVILQVAYFKLTKGKRIFLMAPLHHHFQRKGIFEGKIVVWYFTATLVVAAVCVAAYLFVN
ncbi:MAG: phospho-N-acetylmuramoyl-pentapeptide-transferase [Clostridiales bacterium]|jgi:phospho-N-acetylmuramoyl-pentapeptide-transferase|nr:phospho-N-acetylmuramoyl-pentapeptide-transferase [Clostridiales bacterium]